MKLELALLATLTWLTNNHHWEPKPEREARLWPTAVALAEESQDVRELSFALSQGFFESRFHRDIGWLKCKPGQCDPRSGTHRAKGFWQNWRVETTPEWARLWDVQRGQATAHESVQLQLAMQRKMACGGNMVHAFSAHDGKGCRFTKRGQSREAFRRRVEARLRKEMIE